MKKKLKVHTLKKALTTEKNNKKSIGFVPTMGALHSGHISLIEASKSKADITVCSIFVNPTQFNDTNDLDKYPRTISADTKLLQDAGCDYLFFPSVEDVYPPNLDTSLDINLDGLDERMEGKFRPGHFAGVVEVVNRLLNIVEPDYLFMGQKDFQQFTIIQKMLDVINSEVELVICPIKREPHGLAMSSRNERLSQKTRLQAGIIHQTLLEIKQKANHLTIGELITYGTNKMKIPGFEPEYLSIVDGHTLEEIHTFSEHEYVVACTAVWVENVRLIDNIIIKK